MVLSQTQIRTRNGNVMAVNQGTKAMDGYTITNDKGKFVLNLKPNATYTIKISF
jgi:flagellar basal body P-ring protein FlgI